MKLASTALILTVSLLSAEWQIGLAKSNPETPALTVQVASNASAVNLNFDVSHYEPATIEQNGQEFEAYSLPGEGTTYERNRPLLPAVSRFIIVPPDAGLTLDITSPEPVRVHSERPPALCDDPSVNESLYPMGDLYPPSVAEMSEPGVIRGVRLVKVTIYPIQYDARNHDFLFRDNIQASLRFTDQEPVNPVQHSVKRIYNDQFRKFIAALAVNGDALGRDDPQETPQYFGHYLVVANRDALLWHLPFIEWRRKAGYKMEILSFAAGDAGNSGTVRNAIKARYDDEIQHGQDPFDTILLIGDRQSYDDVAPGAQYVLEAETGNTIWGGASHADYKYALLEGDDEWPDAAFGRLPTGSQGPAQLAVGRLLAYEAAPRMQNPEWFTRAGVYSQHWGNDANSAWHITIHTNVRWGEEVLQRLGFRDITFYENYEWDRMGPAIGPVIRDLLNNGCNMLIGRAENYYWRYDFNGVNNNTVFPINLCMSGHGEWTSWHMFRTGDAQNLKGPVTATFCWGGPPTATNSYVWMQLVNSVMDDDMTVGWGRVMAITSIEKYFPNFNEAVRGQPIYLHVKTDVDLNGDPGIQPWIGVPRELHADFPQALSPDTRRIEVHVSDPHGNANIQDARVSLYAPGSIPTNNAADYANYNSILMKNGITDADGIARFVLEDGEQLVNATHVYLTVTGRDIRPVFGDVTVAVPGSAIDLTSWSLAEVEGNGDDNPNPGETFDLSLTAINLGNRSAVQSVHATVISNSPWVDVDQNDISFGDIAANSHADGDSPARIRFDASTPDARSRPYTEPELLVSFSSGQTQWMSALRIKPLAPRYHVRRLYPSNIIEVHATNFDLDLDNIGAQSGEAMTGRLVSRGMGISVVRDRANYNTINSGNHARLTGDPFILTGSQLAVPGSTAPMLLILEAEHGFVDTVAFDLQVGSTRAGAPLGPDKFGYICFDDGDNTWDMAPRYNWVEINPGDQDEDLEGTRVNFAGQSNFDIGECKVLPLGFETQFYGQTFDSISIATNGFISMGVQPRITNFQNWPLNEAIGGGAGMIAPLWDDLRLGQGSGIYTFYNRDEHYFLVEWYRMHASTGNAEFTFQAILYDHEFWGTETGDQNILFQYKTVTADANIRDGDQQWVNNIPYASVGISSPDGTTGINYCFDNVYPTAAAVLQNHRALLFSTSPKFRSGILYGHVTDAATGAPVEGATVITQHGFSALTNAQGYWRIGRALANIDFYITCHKDGYNDSTLIDLNLAEDDSMAIDFVLLHPEFRTNFQRLDCALHPGDARDLQFTLQNSGNGPLTWRVDKRLIGDANAQPWELRRTYHFYQTTHNSRMEGAAFDGEHFFVSGSPGRRSNLVYIFDRDGALTDSFNQAGNALYGYKQLDYDGELLWGSGDTIVYGFTTDGQVVKNWMAPFRPTNYIAWDPDRSVYWMSATTSNIAACDIDGRRVRQDVNRHGLNIYGLCYWPDDPEGCGLYISTGGLHNVPPKIYKMNPDNGDTILVRTMPTPPANTNYSSAFVCNTFDVYSWVMMLMVNTSIDSGGDRLEIYQLDARRDWFNLDNWSGVVDAGGNQPFTLSLNAVGLPAVLFEGELVFTHNAVGGRTIIPVSLDVQAGVGNVDNRRIPLIAGWNAVSLNIDPQHPDMPTIMQPLVDAGALSLVKDGEGRFYQPANGFNNIPGWAAAEGYLMYMNQDATLTARGVVIPPDRPIRLAAGWNLGSYYPRQSADPLSALDRITQNLIIAKDGHGGFYMPAYGFSNLDRMSELNAYYFKVSQDVDLIYDVQEGRAAEHSAAKPLLPDHFRLTGQNGPENLSLLLLGSAETAGLEAGVFVGDRLVGAGRFDDNGRCGIAVWGDDPATSAIEGAATGDALSVSLWDGKSEHPVVVKPLEGEMSWSAAGVTVAKLDTGIPTEFGLTSAYPNPFNGMIRLAFGISNEGPVKLAIYDLNGRLVAMPVNGSLRVGLHQIVWNANMLPTGLYIARLEAAGKSDMRKLMLVK